MSIYYIAVLLFGLCLFMFWLIIFLDPKKRSKKLKTIAEKHGLDFTLSDSQGNHNIITGKINSVDIYFCDKGEKFAIEKLYNSVGKRYERPFWMNKEENLDIKDPLCSKERISMLKINGKTKMVGIMLAVRDGMSNFSNACMPIRDVSRIFNEISNQGTSNTFNLLKTGKQKSFYRFGIPYVREEEDNFLTTNQVK